MCQKERYSLDEVHRTREIDGMANNHTGGGKLQEKLAAREIDRLLSGLIISIFIEWLAFSRISAGDPLYFAFFSLSLSSPVYLVRKGSEKLFERKLIADEKVEMDGDRIGTNFAFPFCCIFPPFSSEQLSFPPVSLRIRGIMEPPCLLSECDLLIGSSPALIAACDLLTNPVILRDEQCSNVDYGLASAALSQSLLFLGAMKSHLYW